MPNSQRGPPGYNVREKLINKASAVDQKKDRVELMGERGPIAGEKGLVTTGHHHTDRPVPCNERIFLHCQPLSRHLLSSRVLVTVAVRTNVKKRAITTCQVLTIRRIPAQHQLE